MMPIDDGGCHPARTASAANGHNRPEQEAQYDKAVRAMQ